MSVEIVICGRVIHFTVAGSSINRNFTALSEKVSETLLRKPEADPSSTRYIFREL
jgi:hypothetical protein